MPNRPQRFKRTLLKRYQYWTNIKRYYIMGNLDRTSMSNDFGYDHN